MGFCVCTGLLLIWNQGPIPDMFPISFSLDPILGFSLPSILARIGVNKLGSNQARGASAHVARLRHAKQASLALPPLTVGLAAAQLVP